MTVAEALFAGRARLHADGDAGRFDAVRLLEECLERSAAWIVAHRDDLVEPAAYARYDRALERRAHGEPVAYIVGSAGFYGRTFEVGPSVLVPRPESEHLIELALAALAERDPSAAPPEVCDVGTGSGVLAVTIACECPAASVTAIDISAEALEVAERNARAHGVEARVRFVRGDGLRELPENVRFDCIIANLPYVRSADMRARPDPTAYEPPAALDGGADGLAAYRRLLPGADARLAAPGVALFEAGPDTAGALGELALRAFAGANVTVHRDYGGRQRVVDVRRGAASPSEKPGNP